MGEALPLGVNFGATLAMDRLLRPLIENGFLPPSFAPPLEQAGQLGLQYGLFRLGLTRIAASDLIASYPAMTGFSLFGSALLDGMGVKPGFARDVGGMALGATPALLASKIPEFAASSPYAFASGVSRLAGGAALINEAAETTADVIGKISVALSSVDNHIGNQTWRLCRMALQMYNQERGGSFLAGGFDGFLTLADSVRGLFDDDFADERKGRIREIRDEIVQGTDDVGNYLHQELFRIAAGRVGPDGRIDWEGVRADVRSLYQRDDLKETLANTYSLVESATAPLNRSGIDELIGVVDRDGEIANLEEFQRHLGRQAERRRIENLWGFGQALLDMGLGRLGEGEDLIDVEPTFTDVSELDSTQIERLLPFCQKEAWLEPLETLLDTDRP
jgi:hypothetical protein